MAEMSTQDLRMWAKEEIVDAVKELQKRLHEDPEETFDERAAIDREVRRVLKFLGVER